MTTVAEIARKAATHTNVIITHASARTISSYFVAIPQQRIGSRGAFFVFTRRTAVTFVTHTADNLVCIPGTGVHPSGFFCQHAFGEAHAAVVAVVRTDLTLASDAVVAVKTLTQAGLSIANALVGAFSDGVKVVVSDHGAYPGEVLGTGALGAVRAGPLRLTVQPSITFAVIIVGTNASMVAFVRAKAGFPHVDLLVTHHLSPVFFDVRWSRTGYSRGLARRGD